MERPITDHPSRNLVLRDAPPPGGEIATWREFWIFVLISAAVVITIIGGGLAVVALWEVI